MEYKDYYKILGVEKNSDQKEIKKAYRTLARQYHPDVNPGDKAAETRFKEINEANEVLSDPEKRRKYDELGENYQRYQQTGGGASGFDWSQYATGGYPGGGGVRYEYVDANEVFGGAGFSDFFESIFGGAGRGYGGAATSSARAERAPRDVEQPVDITLEEAYHGASRGLTVDNRQLEVKIPPGVKTGSKVRVAGEAPAAGRGAQRGDIYLVINVLPHPVFERRSDDLYTEMPVDLFTALLGGETQVPTMTGPVALRIPPGTQQGRVFRLAGQGMPKLRAPQEHGNLYAKARVMLPERLSEREEQLLREWSKLRGAS
jgi:curved DNA-binding protein